MHFLWDKNYYYSVSCGLSAAPAGTGRHRSAPVGTGRHRGLPVPAPAPTGTGDYRYRHRGLPAPTGTGDYRYRHLHQPASTGTRPVPVGAGLGRSYQKRHKTTRAGLVPVQYGQDRSVPVGTGAGQVRSVPVGAGSLRCRPVPVSLTDRKKRCNKMKTSNLW
jgi:hypothetical protein